MYSRQAVTFIVAYKITKQREKKKKCWIKKWEDRRNQFEACSTLVNKLRLDDAQQFRNFIRMFAEQFEVLLDLVKRQIVKHAIRNFVMQFLFMTISFSEFEYA